MAVNGKSLIEIVSVLVLAGGLVLVAYQIGQATSIADSELRAEGTSRNLDQYRAIATELAAPGTD